MPPLLTFEYNPLSYEYPDDETDKELFFQASSTRPSHLRAIFIYWVNTVFSDGEEVWQVVRLDQRDNRVKYVYPDMIVVDGCEREHNATFSLGVFNRDQREMILDCADEIEYETRSSEEEQCLRWMGRLLHRLIQEGLLAREVVEPIRHVVSLPL